VLALGREREERIDHVVDGASFLDDVGPGDHVAVHWGFACDRLTDEQVARLEHWTQWQLAAMAPRLARSPAR
jgi:hydrogenase maturation factor